jgi:hypothetical protein
MAACVFQNMYSAANSIIHISIRISEGLCVLFFPDVYVPKNLPSGTFIREVGLLGPCSDLRTLHTRSQRRIYMGSRPTGAVFRSARLTHSLPAAHLYGKYCGRVPICAPYTLARSSAAPGSTCPSVRTESKGSHSRLTDGGKVVSLTHRPRSSPQTKKQTP